MHRLIDQHRLQHIVRPVAILRDRCRLIRAPIYIAHDLYLDTHRQVHDENVIGIVTWLLENVVKLLQFLRLNHRNPWH